MENEYVLFSAGLFGLIFGGFGMLASGAFLVGMGLGLISLGTVGLIAMLLTFVISSLGAVAAYLWFIDAA